MATRQLSAAEEAELVALAAAYRDSSSKQAAAAAYIALAYWRSALRLDDIDGSARLWLDAVLPYILRARNTVGKLAQSYARATRRIEVDGDVTRLFSTIPEPNLEQVRESLRIVGPAILKHDLKKTATARHVSQADVDAMVATAGVRIQGAATRHVTNGGRETIAEGSRNDSEALGYIWVTDEDPCYFCSMLASRGPTYSRRSLEESNARFTGPGTAKVHDHCHCHLKPVYRRTDPMVKASEALYEEWKAVQRNRKPDETMALAWRHHWEQRSTDQRSV